LFFEHLFIIFVPKKMGRTKKKRWVQMAPCFGGFNPAGTQRQNKEKIFITFEEYEALNLCDYELLTQAEAARMMNVSRPTFTRIYESARRKVAKAFVECTPIRFDKGNVYIIPWYYCSRCSINFTLPRHAPEICPFCKQRPVIQNN